MNRKNYHSIPLLLVGLLCLINGHAQQLRTIVIHPDAAANERLAANEVQRYAYLISGRLYPVVEKTAKENKSGHIYIGKVFLPEGMPEDAGIETFIVKNISNNLYLTGQSDITTLYSAYHFAEMLGVRFHITEDIIPDRDKTPILIPPVNEKQMCIRDRSRKNISGLNGHTIIHSSFIL